MTVVLEAPLTRAGGYGSWGTRHGPDMPLTAAPRYMRTAGMSRWHRPRSGYVSGFHGGRCIRFWCGPGLVWRDGVLTAGAAAEGELVCGTCEGRAAGAGQDIWPVPSGPLLVFSPRRLVPPKVCPGSRRERLAEDAGDRVLRCLACRQLVPGRSSGGPYNGVYGPVRHAPGPDLVAGCPFHAWNDLVLADGLAVCACSAGEAAP